MTELTDRAAGEWDEWLTLFADRNDVADEYARQLAEPSFTTEWWAGFNAAIVRRWSRSGLVYIKNRAWKQITASPTSTTGISDALQAPVSAPVCVRCVRLEEALREIANSNGQRDVAGCTCGHKQDFCHRWNAARWCGQFDAPARARAALAAVGVPPDGET